MSQEIKNASKSALNGIDAAGLRLISTAVAAHGKAEKASESLNRSIEILRSADLHTVAGFSNFGKWVVAAFSEKGVSLSKSRVYNALRVADVRAAAPSAANLSDTVCLRISESAPLGNPEKVEAFAAEVVATGGTVEAVRTIKGAEDKRDPVDAAAEDFAKRIVRLCKGDAKGATAAIEYARREVERLMIEAVESAVRK